MTFDENAQRYLKALLAIALVLIFVPLADITLRAFNTDAGSLQWRFGLVGLLFGNAGTVLLGLGLAGLSGVLTERRGIVRAVGIVSLILAVVFLALLVLFALDAVQMRRLVAIPIKRQVLTSSVSAAFSAFLGTLALVVLGRGALAASRADRSATRRPKAAPLVAQSSVAGVAPRAGAGDHV